jgi:hypothetical protein
LREERAADVEIATRAPADPREAEIDAALARLRSFENEARGRTRFEAVTGADHGADPVALVALAGDRAAALLQGRDAVVLVDGEGRELARRPAPASPRVIARGEDGAVYVAGERTATLARYRATATSLAEDAAFRVDGVVALGDLVAGERGLLYAVEEHDDRLLVLAPPRDGRPGVVVPVWQAPFCAVPARLVRAGATLVASCLVDHALVAVPLGADGLPALERSVRVVHDGPFWGLAAIETEGGTIVAAGGIEDRPLDRSGGFFGYVDSFVYLYSVPRGGGFERLAALNTSEHGVVTPKALLFETRADAAELLVTGYGGERRLGARFDLADLARGAALAPRSLEVTELPPGTTALARLESGAVLGASRLLDAFLVGVEGRARAVPVLGGLPSAGEARARAETRLGEALVFTTLMGPGNPSEGAHSRFSCEACHLGGYVDGRTHHTGRGTVHATTKPLFGLFNNKPHFTRALDPDMTRVAHAEFNIAGAGSGHDPWFTLTVAEHPWLEVMLGEEGARVLGARVDPESLRRAFMRFLMHNPHPPSPRAVGRARFDAREQRGAEIFRDRCTRCHAARLVADDAASAVPFERWEALVLSPAGPIVWASDGYRKTGVEPYVHPLGARTTSLRRLYKKRPHFTNGSARTLADVLAAVRFDAERFWHAGAPLGAARLSGDERQALLAFLRLL